MFAVRFELDVAQQYDLIATSDNASMSACSRSAFFAKLAPRKGNPASEEPGFSAKRFDCGGGAGTAQLMSHHMSHFAHTSDDERLSLVACSAFERTALDASCVHRFNQSDRGLPAACGASSQYTLGGRIGGMHVVSFRCGTLCVSLESTSAARTPYDGRLDRALSLRPVDQSSLYNIDHFPSLKLGR
jgi:hypothetical protein